MSFFCVDFFGGGEVGEVGGLRGDALLSLLRVSFIFGWGD